MEKTTILNLLPKLTKITRFKSLCFLLCVSIASFSVQAQDSDGDGIGDAVDLDDDNDGIPDLEECISTVLDRSSGSDWEAITGDIDDLQVGDVLVKRLFYVDPVTTTEYDLRAEILATNTTGASFGGIIKFSDTNFLLEDGIPNQEEHFEFSFSFVETASVTAGNLAGTVATFDEVKVEMFDLDPNRDADFTDIAGFDSAGILTSVGSGLSAYTLTNGETVYGITDFSAGGQSNTDSNYAIEFTYVNTSTFVLKHGVFGTGGDSGNRGGIVVMTVVTCPDSDNDGVADYLDVDSDNDGIYDIVESGANSSALDTNNDGVIDDTQNFGANGLANAVEDNDTSTATGTTPTETTAGTPDYLNLDSDGDGCSDANEAYNVATADGGDGGIYNTAGDAEPYSVGAGVDADGSVTAAAYSDPSDFDTNSTADYQQPGGPDRDEDGLPDACDEIFNDNDGDGIPDNVDLDNDNDGILDTDEIDCDNPSLLIRYQSGTNISTFNPLTGVVAVESAIGTNNDYNGIAYNYDNGGLVYGHSIANTSEITVYDPVTGLTTSVGTVAGVDFTLGGGTYYNGVLYLGDVGNSLYAITLSLDGKTLVSSTLFSVVSAVTIPGGWGDLAVGIGCNGNPTLFMSVIGGGLFELDLTTTTATGNVGTLIESTYLGQIAYIGGVLYSINGANAFASVNVCTGISTPTGFSIPGPDIVVDLAGGSIFCTDTDMDGVPDYLDVDSDNDGIYDVVETGNGALDTDNDGMIDATQSFGDNGLADTLESDDTSAATTTDPVETTTGIPDYLNLDSDGDGCSDANEAYNVATADGGDGGIYNTAGDAEPYSELAGTITSNGAVTAAAYSDPVDSDTNTIDDQLEVGPDTDFDGISDACDTVLDVIDAIDDAVTVDGTLGADSINIIDDNDTYNGAPAVLGTTVTITTVTDPDLTDGVSLDPLTGDCNGGCI